MNNKNKRNFASLLFMVIFSVKVAISIMPAFSIFDAKVAASVILQLEQETKAEKDTTDKDALKEKKDFDDEHLYTSFDYKPVLLQTARLHSVVISPPGQPYNEAVPTPPPNA